MIWTASAIKDLAALRRYIGRRNRTAAREIASRILDSVDRLALYPGSGRPGRKPDTRELVIVGTPFLVPYRVRKGTLQILRVLHGARRWPPK